jgi:hypothetical protein
MVIPVFYTERCYIYQPGLQDAGFLDQASQFYYTPENMWLSKK